MHSDSRLVASRASLSLAGWTEGQIRAQLAARRWQLCGNAVILHNGPLSKRQRWDAALINTGPRAILTAFTAAEYLGLTGW